MAKPTNERTHKKVGVIENFFSNVLARPKFTQSLKRLFLSLELQPMCSKNKTSADFFTSG